MLLRILFGITLIGVFPDYCVGMSRRPHGPAGVSTRSFRYGTGVGPAEGVDPDPLPSDSPVVKRNPYDIMVGSRMHRQTIGSGSLGPGGMEGPVHDRYFGSGRPSALVKDEDDSSSAALPRFYRGANRNRGPMASGAGADSGRQFLGPRASASEFRRGQGFARRQPIVPY